MRGATGMWVIFKPKQADTSSLSTSLLQKYYPQRNKTLEIIQWLMSGRHSGYEPGGRRFESFRARQKTKRPPLVGAVVFFDTPGTIRT